MEVPATLLNLESKSIKNFYFYVYDGQAWVDRIGTAPPDSPARTVRDAYATPAPQQEVEQWASRPRISLSASADYIDTESDSNDTRRISLYSPELTLLSEWNVEGESETVAAEYLFFGGEPVAQIEGSGPGTIHWNFNDHLGAPIVQTDAAANIVWRVEREPFGEVYAYRAGANHRQPLALPGQEDEVGSEDSYNVHRWFRPGMGRFLSVDPTWESADLGSPQSWNRYSYVLNNPINDIDPDGRCGVRGACPEPERATSEQKLWNSFKENFIPEIPSADKPLVLDPENRPVETAINMAKIAAIVSPVYRMLTRPSVLVFRVHGGGARQFGRSWTRVDPTNVANYREAAGLPNANTGEYVTTGIVKVKDIKKVTKAIPLDGNSGGADEVIIENSKRSVKVIKTTKVDPAL
ncbi:MAG TPA: RHS repeat-associated core domain-containing protein [Thermoanaerobaculia bacterium]|jgi:RHS repeat-associated protein|nr:RHS repeat-associated core domain-containing protein [Thermoanaerobaculia bacterium]